jgi:hypothetical protein
MFAIYSGLEVETALQYPVNMDAGTSHMSNTLQMYVTKQQLDKHVSMVTHRHSSKGTARNVFFFFFFNFPLYLQSVPIHSANVVKLYTKACRRVLASTLL